MIRKLSTIVLVTLLLFACKKNDTKQPSAMIAELKCPTLEVTPEQREVIRHRADLLNSTHRLNYIEGMALLLVDFDGATVTNTDWNNTYGSTITCTAANLTTTQKQEIIARVREDYKAFFVNVTDNEAEWADANPYARMRIIVTGTSLSTTTAGLAYVNSITWGDQTPCFVFSNVLNNVTKSVAEAVSHESGHTFGLHHWAQHDPNGQWVVEYHPGIGSGNNSWAPIMGSPYEEAITTFGPNATLVSGPNDIEDEFSIISQTALQKVDNVGSTITNNYYTQYGISFTTGWSWGNTIEFSTDADMYKVTATAPYYLKVESYPQMLDGGNTDLAVDLYNSSGTLLSTMSNTNDINVGPSQVTNPNVAYIKVRAISGQSYAPIASMRGGYVVSLY